jgi:hypothetical protein
MAKLDHAAIAQNRAYGFTLSDDLQKQTYENGF